MGSAVPVLIIALRKGAKRIITELLQWNESILGCYVEPAKPGLYERTMSSEINTDYPSERDNIVAKRTSFITGQVESTDILYVYDNGKWLHVWVLTEHITLESTCFASLSGHLQHR